MKAKYPIPLVDELLDELHGACFFTKRSSCYHQVHMHPDDITKTVSRTHRGLFEFMVMPFELTNTPSTFQAMMNEILKPFIRSLYLYFLMISWYLAVHGQRIYNMSRRCSGCCVRTSSH